MVKRAAAANSTVSFETVAAIKQEMENNMPTTENTIPAADDVFTNEEENAAMTTTETTALVPAARPALLVPGNHTKEGLADDHQHTWNNLVDRACQGSYTDRAKLVNETYKRWQAANQLRLRFPKNYAIAQVSLKWKSLYEDLKAKLATGGNNSRWNLDALVEHPLFQEPGLKNTMAHLSAFSRVDQIRYLEGVRGSVAGEWIRGIGAEKLNSYCVVVAAPQGYALTQGNKTVIITAESLYHMHCSAVEGTYQEIPFSNDGVLGNSGVYDGYTFVLPAGYQLRFANGKVMELPRALRISMPFNESVWNCEAPACAMTTYTVSSDRQQLMDLRVQALRMCFAEANNGFLQPRDERQLAQVHAVYLWLKNSDSVFASGNVLADMNEDILLDIDRFWPAWQGLEARRKQKRQSAYQAKVAANAAKRGPVKEEETPATQYGDDFDPCFSDEEEDEI